MAIHDNLNSNLGNILGVGYCFNPRSDNKTELSKGTYIVCYTSENTNASSGLLVNMSIVSDDDTTQIEELDRKINTLKDSNGMYHMILLCKVKINTEIDNIYANQLNNTSVLGWTKIS